MKFIHNPLNDKDDPMMTLAFLAGVACIIKFLFEGVSFTIMGHIVNLGHVDSMTYVSLLTPVLGAHSYIHVNGKKDEEEAVK
jgi:hypothetical protein